MTNNTVSVKWINLNGNKYIQEKTLLVTAVNSNDLPEFGLVSNIYVIISSLHCSECSSILLFDMIEITWHIQ